MAPTKSRNLNDHERTYVCLKIKEFYDHRNGVFLRGGRQEVKKRCDRANIGISIDTIRRYAREMRDQERAATDLPSGEASGVDLSPNRRGKCGAKTKLTPTLQEGYRKVIERYAYSWRYLARRELQRELRKKSHCISTAEKMMHVQEAFKAYPKDKITDIWGCYFNNLRGIMKETGGNQYKPAHNDSRNRRKETGSPIDLSVNLEDYISCLDFLSD
jgi:hypothetical protein